MKPPLKQGSPSDFQTPKEAIIPLLPYLKKDWLIWEPACGTGNIVSFLNLQGFQTVGTDILSGYDFLSNIPIIVSNFDCIVTNPPYTLKQQFLERCYKLGKPFALLLPLTTFETRKRQKLFRDNGLEVIFLPERVRFETPTGRKEDESSPWFAVCWITWKFNIGKELTFWEPENHNAQLF